MRRAGAAPRFRLAELQEPARTFDSNDMHGKVWMLNVWASWCVSCRAEHEVLTALARTGAVRVYGLDYKDERGNALSFLKTFGNPYAAGSVADLPAMLLTYDFGDLAEMSAVKALAGEIPVGGRLPVAIPGIAAVGEGLMIAK